MMDQDKSKQELLEELAEARRRVAVLEESLANQQLAEKALRESEERYRLLAEAIPHPVWRSDAEGRQIDCNRRWQEYTGQTPEEAQGNGWMKALHPDDVAWALQRVREDVPGGNIYQAEYRLHRASDDSYHWYLARAIPQRDANGTILGWFGSAMDIDDQKRAEQALQKSEERFRKVFEEGPIGILLGGTDGSIQHANRGICEMLGYSEGEIIAVGLAGISHPDDWERDSPLFSRLWHGEMPYCHLEKRYLRKDGRTVHCQLTVSLMYDEAGRPIGTIGMIEDITERKRAEEALQKAHDELEQRVKERTTELAKANENLDIFRKFIDASGVGFGMADLDGTIAYANPILCRLLGEEKLEDVIDKNISAYYPEDYLQRRRDEMIPALLREEYLHTETKVLQRHGNAIPIQQSTFLIRDENGNPFRTGVVISDISERKRAEEALAKEHRHLRDMLRSSDNERQLIAYDIHDGLAQQLAGALMQFQAYDHLKDTQAKQAANAFHAGLTMLQQSHFEARRLIADVRPPVLDEAGVAEAISHLVHEQIRCTGLRIASHTRVAFDRLDPTLENAIYRIAQEALTNACKHSKSEKVQISLLQRGDRVRIEIRDWGVGFDPKAIPKSHFGLEGIRQRARLLNGKCSIRSAAGKGARITVELPVVPRDEEE